MNQLYTQDFFAWTEQQVNLLNLKNFQALDTANLIEEIATLGRNEIKLLQKQ